MSTAFYIVALVMIVSALALVVFPLIRYGRKNGRPRGILVLVLSLGLIMPIGAVLLYALVGQPQAIYINQQSQMPNNMDINQALTQLKAQLDADPDNLEGWVLLARTYGQMQRNEEARDAYAHAMELAPEDADIMVAWVEADSLASADHLIKGRPRSILQKALDIDPDNQRGLWLKGISDYQAGEFSEAVSNWEKLYDLLPADSDVAQAIHEQITMAHARADGKTQQEAESLLQQSTPSTNNNQG